MNKLFTKIAALSVGLAMAAGVGVAVSGHKDANVARATPITVARFSGSSTVEGGTFTTDATSKSGYYQDGSGTAYLQILNNSPYWSVSPSAIYVSATIGAGSAKSLSNPVLVSLLDQSGNIISSTTTTITEVVTEKTGDEYENISIPVVNNVYGIRVSHVKETSYNIRYYAFSLSYEASSDPGLGTMVVSDGSGINTEFTVGYSATVDMYSFTAYDENDTETPLTSVTWASSDTTIATVKTVSGVGKLTCVKPGTISLTASNSGYNNTVVSVEISAGWLEELSISGSMSKTTYTTAESWSPDGFTVRATYHFGWEEDVTNSVVWTYSPAAPAENVTSVVATATLDEESVSSDSQSVTITVAHAGTAEDPFTVAEALAKANEIGTVGNTGQGPWVTTGTISRVTSAPTASYWNATYFISDDGSTNNELQVYRGFYLDNAKFDETTAALLTAGKIVTITGNLTGSYGCEYCQGNYLLSIESPSTGDIDVTFEPSVNYEVGNSGTFIASTTAANPSYTFSVEDETIMSVASNGAYVALKEGMTKVTVNVSSSAGNGEASAYVTVNASSSNIRSVADANSIASSLDSGKTTDYYIYIGGYVKAYATSYNGTNPRAFDIWSEDEQDVIMIFTGTGTYSTFIDGVNIGDYIVIKGNVQNYSGTPEIVNPERISFEYTQVTFAENFLVSTNGTCEEYEAGTKEYAAHVETLEEVWSAYKGLYEGGSLSEAIKAKLNNAEAKESGTTVERAMARYDRLVAKYGLENFISERVIDGSAYVPTSVATNNSTDMLIIVAAFGVSTLFFVTLCVVRKRKGMNK